MIDQVAAAFERQDYRTAAQLLQQLSQDSPQNPWVQFYLGRLDEVSGKLETAEEIYRQLLRNVSNTKIVAQARQGCSESKRSPKNNELKRSPKQQLTLAILN
jgi:predicted Zn-dependent protease